YAGKLSLLQLMPCAAIVVAAPHAWPASAGSRHTPTEVTLPPSTWKQSRNDLQRVAFAAPPPHGPPAELTAMQFGPPLGQNDPNTHGFSLDTMLAHDEPALTFPAQVPYLPPSGGNDCRS